MSTKQETEFAVYLEGLQTEPAAPVGLGIGVLAVQAGSLVREVELWLVVEVVEEDPVVLEVALDARYVFAQAAAAAAAAVAAA
jgi:hypothetical protein